MGCLAGDVCAMTRLPALPGRKEGEGCQTQVLSRRLVDAMSFLMRSLYSL